MMGDTFEPIKTTILPQAAVCLTPLITTGVMTINEVRAKMGLDPIDGGDVAFITTPVGTIPVDRIRDYFEEIYGE